MRNLVTIGESVSYYQVSRNTYLYIYPTRIYFNGLVPNDIHYEGIPSMDVSDKPTRTLHTKVENSHRTLLASNLTQ